MKSPKIQPVAHPLRDLIIVAMISASIPALTSLLGLLYLTHEVNEYQIQVDGVVARLGNARQAEGEAQGEAQGVEHERKREKTHPGQKGPRGEQGPPGPQGEAHHWWNFLSQDEQMRVA